MCGEKENKRRREGVLSSYTQKRRRGRHLEGIRGIKVNGIGGLGRGKVLREMENSGKSSNNRD